MPEYKTSPLAIISTVIVTALVVGGSSFIWQSKKTNDLGEQDTVTQSEKALPSNWEKLTVNAEGDAFGYKYSFEYPADWVQYGDSVTTKDRDLAGKAGAEFYFTAEAANTKGNTHLFRYEFVADNVSERDYFTEIFRRMIESFQFDN